MKFFNAFIVGVNAVLAIDAARAREFPWFVLAVVVGAWGLSDYYRLHVATKAVE